MSLPAKQSRLLAKRLGKPNALKHGAYSTIALFPWEDPDAFEHLRREICSELKPEGPLEADCVETIVISMWRKQRLRTKRAVEFAADLRKVENRVLQQEPPPLFDTKLENAKYKLGRPSAEQPSTPRDDYSQLLGFSTSLYREAKDNIIELSISMLPAEFKNHLRAEVAIENFESSALWIMALKQEVDTVLLPMVRARRPDIESYVSTAAEFLTHDRVMEDVDLEDRLDKTCDRALQRLSWLKTQKKLKREEQRKLINSKPAAPSQGTTE